MEYIAVIVVAALVFGICYLVDKGFTKLFRSQAQHVSGKAVRLNKKYGSIGLIMVALGVAAIFSGLSTGALMLVCGSVLVLVGIGLVVYYMTFGIFYDDDAFVLTTFGKKSQTYPYKDILTQQLYVSYGNIVVELNLQDQRSFQVQLSMKGAAEFLDHAFAKWLEQNGKTMEECPFHDTKNSCWFPPAVPQDPTEEEDNENKEEA